LTTSRRPFAVAAACVGMMLVAVLLAVLVPSPTLSAPTLYGACVGAAVLLAAAAAAAHVIRQSTMVDERCIFPAFWGPNFDETPDQDHGSNIILGVASMLIQSGDDDRILPAWPGQWDVHFRLPAGKNRFAECVYRDEKIVSLEYKNS